LLAGEVDPPPADGDAPGADDDVAVSEATGALAGADVADVPDVCVAPGAVLDELDVPEHPAMAPAKASAAPASRTWLARADEVINCPSFRSCIESRVSPLRETLQRL